MTDISKASLAELEAEIATRKSIAKAALLESVLEAHTTLQAASDSKSVAIESLYQLGVPYKEIAAHLGVSTVTIRNWRNKYSIPGCGRGWRGDPEGHRKAALARVSKERDNAA